MRYIVYLLLIANLLFFAWNDHQAQTVTPAVRTVPPLPAGVTSLVTLEEHARGTAAPADGQAIEALTQAAPPSALPTGKCKALGPFSKNDITLVKATARRLAENGVDAVLRSVENRIENGYWIYLSGKDRQHAREMVKKLDELNDTEYYVGMGYFISLGTFEDIERANIRMADLKEKGIDDAILEQRYKNRTEYWLELPQDGVDPELMARLSEEQPGLQVHTVACSQIAAREVIQ
jgi:hypothetical protein